jgi:hypothetical protein
MGDPLRIFRFIRRCYFGYQAQNPGSGGGADRAGRLGGSVSNAGRAAQSGAQLAECGKLRFTAILNVKK